MWEKESGNEQEIPEFEGKGTIEMMAFATNWGCHIDSFYNNLLYE